MIIVCCCVTNLLQGVTGLLPALVCYGIHFEEGDNKLHTNAITCHKHTTKGYKNADYYFNGFQSHNNIHRIIFVTEIKYVLHI